MSWRGWHLPIHLWFGVALLVIAVVPTLAASATYAVQTIQQREQEQRVQDNVRLARAFLIAGVAHWAGPAWQSVARA